MPKYITEALGTFFLVLTIGCVVVSEIPYGPLAIAAGLMAVIYMGGHVSKAHYNPAITLAFYLSGGLPKKEVLPYLAAEMIGAILGALASFLVMGEAIAIAPAAEVSIWQVLLAEILFSFLLALVILNVASASNLAGNEFYGLAIAMVVLAGAAGVGGVSGAAFNPAVGIAHNLFSGNFSVMWYFIVAPCIGSSLAVPFFRWMNPQDFAKIPDA